MIPKKMRLITWDGPLPEIGNYLKTKAGSMYLVIGVRPNMRPEPKSVAGLDILKLFEDDKKDVPSDAKVYEIWWTGR